MFTELAYAEVTSQVDCTATTEAGADTIITAPAITANGTDPILIEFRCATWANLEEGPFECRVSLFEDGTTLGMIWRSRDLGQFRLGPGFTARCRLIPAAGSRTYSVRGWVSVASTFSIDAGTLTAGDRFPIHIWIWGEE